MAFTSSPSAPKLPFGGSVNAISFFIAGGAPKRTHWRLAQLVCVGLVSCGVVAAAALVALAFDQARASRKRK